MEPILDRGHLLGVDSFYTDVTLFKVLLNHQTHAVGTIRRNRSKLPQDIKESKKWKKREQGRMMTRFHHDKFIMSWMDRRTVTILSTTDTLNRVIKKEDPKKEKGEGC